jgi:hypothetical protein
METFTIFDGYTEYAITPEERVQLEPLIDI